MSKLKRIPAFKTEAEERKFWETHDSTDYIDWSKAERVRFRNLKRNAWTRLCVRTRVHGNRCVQSARIKHVLLKLRRRQVPMLGNGHQVTFQELLIRLRVFDLHAGIFLDLIEYLQSLLGFRFRYLQLHTRHFQPASPTDPVLARQQRM